MDLTIQRACFRRPVVCIFVILSLSGCSTLSRVGSKKPLASAASVELTPWLHRSTRTVLASENSSLAELLGGRQAKQSRSHTQLVAAALKEKERVEHFLFDDNCVVLQRGNAYWYFLEPTDVLILYAGSVRLKDGDKIFTLPFHQSLFFTADAQTGPQYAVCDLMRPVESRQVPESESRTIAAALFNEEALAGWTTSVVTRADRGAMHHLVLPGPIDSNSGLPFEIAQRLTYTRMLAGISGSGPTLRSGDLIERLNVVQLTERF